MPKKTRNKNRMYLRRKALNLTQVQLAEASGLAQATLSKIERQDSLSRASMHPDTLDRLATSLGVTVDYLVGESDEMPEGIPTESRPKKKPATPASPKAPDPKAPEPEVSEPNQNELTLNDLDLALGVRFDPEIHRITDVGSILSSFSGAPLEALGQVLHEREDLHRMATLWLLAAAKLRQKGISVTTANLLFAATAIIFEPESLQ